MLKESIISSSAIRIANINTIWGAVIAAIGLIFAAFLSEKEPIQRILITILALEAITLVTVIIYYKVKIAKSETCRKKFLCDYFCDVFLKNFKTEKYKEKLHKNSAIYSQMTITEYSDYSELIAQNNSIKKIFTIFEFEPSELLKIVARCQNVPDETLDNDDKLKEYINDNANGFWNVFYAHYPHFKTFGRLTQKKQIDRVLIKFGDPWTQRNKSVLQSFSENLGFNNESTFVLDKAVLAAEQYLITDYVIYVLENKDKLILRYNMYTKTLIKMYLKSDMKCDEFLLKHFEDYLNDADSPYIKFNVFIE